MAKQNGIPSSAPTPDGIIAPTAPYIKKRLATARQCAREDNAAEGLK